MTMTMLQSRVVLLILSAILAGSLAFDSPKQHVPPPIRGGVCSRRGLLGEFQTAFGAAACLLVAPAAGPSPAVAATPAPRQPRRPPAFRFDNAYDDDMHPGCTRRISVESVPTTSVGGGDEKSYPVKFAGTDVGPDGIGPLVKIACTDETIEKYKLREWYFDGRVNAEGTDIDAGDGIHVGRWHAPTEDQPWVGIRWKDDNRWVVKEEVAKEEVVEGPSAE